MRAYTTIAATRSKRLGRYEEALASYDRALALAPDLADAHHNRGNTLDALRGTRKRLPITTGCWQLRPRHVAALNRRGNALAALERPMRRSRPMTRRSHDRAGQCRGAQQSQRGAGDARSARGGAAKLRSRACGRARLRRCALQSRQCLARARRLEEARASYAAALDDRAAALRCAQQYGLALVGLGRHDEALKNFDAALAARSGSSRRAAQPRQCARWSWAPSKRLSSPCDTGLGNRIRCTSTRSIPRGVVLAKLRRFPRGIGKLRCGAGGCARSRRHRSQSRHRSCWNLTGIDEALAGFDTALQARSRKHRRADQPRQRLHQRASVRRSVAGV